MTSLAILMTLTAFSQGSQSYSFENYAFSGNLKEQAIFRGAFRNVHVGIQGTDIEMSFLNRNRQQTAGSYQLMLRAEYDRSPGDYMVLVNPSRTATRVSSYTLAPRSAYLVSMASRTILKKIAFGHNNVVKVPLNSHFTSLTNNGLFYCDSYVDSTKQVRVSYGLTNTPLTSTVVAPFSTVQSKSLTQ